MNVTPKKRLKTFNLSATKPRIAILEYLMNHHTHPTCETIYRDLHPTIETLSLTTVYNTVKCLADCGVIQIINIDQHSICADANVEPHIHFLCTKCKKIYDLPMFPEIAKLQNVGGHLVEESQLYLKGLCKECAAKAHAIRIF